MVATACVPLVHAWRSHVGVMRSKGDALFGRRAARRMTASPTAQKSFSRRDTCRASLRFNDAAGLCLRETTMTAAKFDPAIAAPPCRHDQGDSHLLRERRRAEIGLPPPNRNERKVEFTGRCDTAQMSLSEVLRRGSTWQSRPCLPSKV